MLKSIFVAAVFFTAITSQVSAQQWSAKEEQGIRSASINYGSTVLIVNCVTTAANASSSLRVNFYRAGPEGILTFDFGGGTVLPVPFQNGALTANTAVNKQLFAQIASLLKSRSTVTVADPSVGAQQTFSLKGSSRAIGLCEVLTGQLAPTVQQPQSQENLVLNLETYLAQLGFNPGTIDGIADTDTSNAISIYQTARGLPISGGMTLQEYSALEQEIVRFRATGASQLSLQQTATRPTSTGGGVKYHRLADCAGERGIMIYNYRMAIDQPMFLEFSDVCWYANEGRLDGVEPQSDLTLAVRSDDGREEFEVLSSGSQDFERTAVWIGRNTVENDAEWNDGSTSISHKPNSRQRAVQNGAALFRGAGYLVSSSFPPSAASTPFRVSFQVSAQLPNSSQGGVCKPRRPRLASFEGVIDIRNTSQIVMTPSGVFTDRDKGTLTLAVDANGKITGSSSIYFENPRISGHGPCEWLRAEINIDSIIGNTSGSKWLAIKGMGIGSGRYTDVNGDTFALIARATLIGYPEDLIDGQ